MSPHRHKFLNNLSIITKICLHNLIGCPNFWLLTCSGDVINLQLHNFGSRYETTAAKKSIKVIACVSLLPFDHYSKLLGRMTILFEDTAYPEAAMPFWKLQFNINYKTAILVVCAHGCCVYCCLFINLIALLNYRTQYKIISLLKECASIHETE